MAGVAGEAAWRSVRKLRPEDGARFGDYAPRVASQAPSRHLSPRGPSPAVRSGWTSEWAGDLRPQLPSRWPGRAPRWRVRRRTGAWPAGTGARACATSLGCTRPFHGVLSETLVRRLNTTRRDNGEGRVALRFRSALHRPCQ